MSYSAKLSDQTSETEYDYPTTIDSSQDRCPIKTDTNNFVVMFSYANRNYVVPQPVTYDAAVALFRQYIAPEEDLSTRQVTFQAKLPHIFGDEDAEITPAAWELTAKDISQFRVVLQDKAPSKKDQVTKPNASDTGSNTPGNAISLRVFWTDGESGGFVIYVRDNTPFRKIKPTIARRTGIPADKQLLVISRIVKENNMSSTYYVIAKDDDTPATYNLQAHVNINASWDPDKEC